MLAQTQSVYGVKASSCKIWVQVSDALHRWTNALCYKRFTRFYKRIFTKAGLCL